MLILCHKINIITINTNAAVLHVKLTLVALRAKSTEKVINITQIETFLHEFKDVQHDMLWQDGIAR
jgi:hypothetical protein